MKIGPILLLLLLTSTASAQVKDYLFADYVHRVTECCPGRSVVVFYTGTEPFVFREYLKGLQAGRDVPLVSLDDPSKGLRAAITPHMTIGTVAVAYDLGPDAIRVLADVAEKSGAITISTTEEDVYATTFSFDSGVPDRFRRSLETPAGCHLDKCGLTFHSDTAEPLTKVRRATKAFLTAHGKLEPLRKERNGTSRNAAALLKDARERASLVEVARRLEDVLRIVPGDARLNFDVSKDRMLNGEWHDLYIPHHDLGEVFAYFANCEAAEIEWTTSSVQLKGVAPGVLKELQKIRKQNCG